jgi:hypothetical protein
MIDYTDPNSWPDTSYAANERDLADMISDDVLEWMTNVNDYQNIDLDDDFINSFFVLLMMSEETLLGATGAAGLTPQDERRAHRLALRRTIEYDTNENSGEYFTIRIRQRLVEGG